jgi:hypothetical protein
MIFSYELSNTGSSHIEEGKPNQDAKKTVSLQNGIVIAAIADGVGTCNFADVASKIAVRVSTEYCENKLKNHSDSFLLEKIIEDAFTQAELEIEKQSLKDNQPLPEYDTTLDLVIYDGKRVTYGHCGDGGIIGLTEKGEYLKITSPQKREGRYVIPLRYGSRNKNNTWIFGHEENIASVLLATDGIYNELCPPLLKGQKVEVYIPLIRDFMDNNELKISKETVDSIRKKREKEINSEKWSSVTDDKTLVVLVNEAVMPEMKEASYYEKPNWAKLQEEVDKKLYPHLFEKKDDIRNKEVEAQADYLLSEQTKKDSTDSPLIGFGKKKYEFIPKPFCTGGDSQLHNINGQSNMVAKIYHNGRLTKELEEKIKYMVDNPLDQKALNQVAWPQDIFYSKDGQFLGYVMLKLPMGEYLDIIYEYGDSAKYKNMTWKDKIRIACNICLILEFIHKNGHCCGDLNPRNIRVDPKTKQVVFVDSDSFQIQDGDKIYRCTTGISKYLPVEILNKINNGYSFESITHPPIFTQDTDNFVLAIHIFRLLMNGCHPFACAIDQKKTLETTPQPVDNILKGIFSFMKSMPGVKIPMYAPSINILPSKIKALFKRAFIDGHNSPNARPKPQEWHTAMSELIQKLGQCKKVSHHLYWKGFWGFKSCPWCEVDRIFTMQTAPAIKTTTAAEKLKLETKE